MYTYCHECVTDLPVKKDLSCNELFNLSCDYFKLTTEQVRDKCKKSELVRVRFMIISYLYSTGKFTEKSAAMIVGRNEHATTHQAVKHVSRKCFTDRKYKKEYNDYVTYMDSFFK